MSRNKPDLEKTENWMVLLDRPLYARERWIALHRLYRMATSDRKGAAYFAPQNLLWILLNQNNDNTRIIRLLTTLRDPLTISWRAPKEIRRFWIKNGFWRKRNESGTVPTD